MIYLRRWFYLRVTIRNVKSKAEEQVTIECVALTPEFEDIRNYCLAKGEYLVGYTDGNVRQMVYYDQILYFEAVGEKVFAYTQNQVYEIKKRLYEIETEMIPYKFIRCSKSFVLCLLKINSMRPALNGRFCAHMKNGEDVIVSRKYVKQVKKAIMEDL